MTTRVHFSRSHLPSVIRKAYELSQPQGLGFLHFQPGSIPEGVLNQIVEQSNKRLGIDVHGVYMDYVLGRSVKLGIPHSPSDDTFYLIDEGRWYDHSQEAWKELVQHAQEGAA